MREKMVVLHTKKLSLYIQAEWRALRDVKVRRWMDGSSYIYGLQIELPR